MTFKNIWFQLHWILGITAGLVLMVVGTTGGILSFEREILRAINTDLMEVQPAKNAVALTPEELLRRIQAKYPERTINALTLSNNPLKPQGSTLPLKAPENAPAKAKHAMSTLIPAMCDGRT